MMLETSGMLTDDQRMKVASAMITCDFPSLRYISRKRLMTPQKFAMMNVP